MSSNSHNHSNKFVHSSYNQWLTGDESRILQSAKKTPIESIKKSSPQKRGIHSDIRFEIVATGCSDGSKSHSEAVSRNVSLLSQKDDWERELSRALSRCRKRIYALRNEPNSLSRIFCGVRK